MAETTHNDSDSSIVMHSLSQANPKDPAPQHDQENGATLPGDYTMSSERTPLLVSFNEDSVNSNYDGKVKKIGRYTPVGSIFNSNKSDVRPKTAWQLPHKDYDSLDYDVCYNVPYKNLLRSYKGKTYVSMEVLRWVLVCIIGMLTGLVAFFIDISVKELFDIKYKLLENVLDASQKHGKVIFAFLALLGFNVTCAIIAASLIALKPVAAGSGIPEIKCYLNGVKVPHVTRLGTLVAKAVGVLFSVSGGFLVGKEGPMIHSGAIIGAGIPQFRSLWLNWLKFPYPYFRSDRDKRDFVSSGAAAGVAAAFGAPIGGVLFSLEEGSSFWNQSLTWRTLFCCFSATFTLNFLVSTSEIKTSGIGFGFLGSPGLVNFGVFNKDGARLWNVYHLVIFAFMGATGGLLGALFNSLNTSLTKYRMKYLAKRHRNRIWNMLEVILIAMVTTSAVFLVAMLLGTCLPDNNIPSCSSPNCAPNSKNDTDTRDFFCPGHTSSESDKVYYNDMATLMFNSQETAIKQLFHKNGAFTLPTLLILFIVYFFVACWTYGASIPSGLFIPCLMIGATYGRFVATIFAYLTRWNPHYFSWLTTLYPGTYALIGAASFLGGVVRMTISLTVILIESTNEIEYGLPIMITVMVAKWVGDIFNHGLYDTHIQLKKTPYLEWELPQQLDKLVAEDVMNSSGSKLSYLYPITRVRSIESLLRTTAHSAFPVVTPIDASSIPVLPKFQHTPQLYTRPSGNVDGYNIGSHDSKQKLVFHGLILRHQLVMLLKNKVFFNETDGPQSQVTITHTELTAEYPRYSDVFSVKLTETERNMLMDFSIFMNPSPYTISKEAPLPQVFTLFRTMGLRHLPVMQESGIVIGIITRHDLTHEKLHEIRQEKRKALNDSPFHSSHMYDSLLREHGSGHRYEERFRSLNRDQTSSNSDEY